VSFELRFAAQRVPVSDGGLLIELAPLGSEALIVPELTVRGWHGLDGGDSVGYAPLLRWLREAAGRLGVVRGWIELSDRGRETESAGLFSKAYWGMWVGGELLEQLGIAASIVASWPGVVAEELPGSGTVYLQISDDPRSLDHAGLLEASEFLRRVLRPRTTPLVDPALDAQAQALLAQGTAWVDWPEAIRSALPFYEHVSQAVYRASPRPSTGQEPAIERYRSAPMPEADPQLQATFKWEDDLDDGERVGPLIVAHPTRGVLWESADWMTESDARALAEEKRWTYAVDG
jgi:hypothetical protein